MQRLHGAATQLYVMWTGSWWGRALRPLGVGTVTTIIVRNNCSLSRVDALFAPIIGEAVEAYRVCLGGLLVSVRLMGSVARGEAKAAESDIDFVGFTTQPCEDSALANLMVRAHDLTLRHACVSRVDLETEVHGQTDPSREFIFRTDSVCVWGADTYPERSVTILPEVLAAQNSPDLGQLVATYRKRVAQATDGAELRTYSRWIGKDLLKSFRRNLILDHAVYDKTPAKIHRRLVEFYPVHRETMDLLLGLYEAPTSDAQKLLLALRMAETAMHEWTTGDSRLERRDDSST